MQNHDPQPHPLGRFIGPVGRDLLRARRSVPSANVAIVRHHHPLGHRACSCLRHVLLRTARHGGALRPAGGEVRLAGSGRLRPVQPLVRAHHGLQLRRSLHPAAAGDRGAGVRGRAGWGCSPAPHSVDLGGLPTVWTLTAPIYMLGGLLFGIATFRAGILPRWAGVLLAVGTALAPVAALLPQRVAAESGGAGGRRSRLARLCALV